MTAPSLGKFLVPTTLAVGAIFSILTAPLALFGSEPLSVQLQEETVFEGKLKDVAVPYLALASALSLSAGVASIAFAGWRRSSRQSNKIEQQLFGMQHQLQEKETQLQALLWSDKQLETSGLKSFLEDDMPLQQPQAAQTSAVSAQSVVRDAFAVQPLVLPAPSVAEPQSEASKSEALHAAVSSLAAAQPSLSFSRSSTLAEAPLATAPSQSGEMVAQISELQTQIQQILSQIGNLQNSVLVESQSALSQRAGVDLAAVPPQAKQRLHKLEAQWVVQEVAS